MDPLRVPKTTALLIMECQKGVLDATGRFAQLAERAREKGIVAAIAKIAAAFRETGRPVVHCLAITRPDGRGRARNAPILRRSTGGLVRGSAPAEVVEGLEPEESDFRVGRMHGVSPFHGTELDSILRASGVTTVVATGVSVNVGVTGLVIEAVNHGFDVLLPTDAVAGVPADYEDAQIQGALRFLARLTSAEEICSALG